MAIKVQGNTVISDSRSLDNITSLDSTTIASFTESGFVTTSGVPSKVNLVATGSLSDGDPVIINSDSNTSSNGTVSVASITETQSVTGSFDANTQTVELHSSPVSGANHRITTVTRWFSQSGGGGTTEKIAIAFFSDTEDFPNAALFIKVGEILADGTINFGITRSYTNSSVVPSDFASIRSIDIAASSQPTQSYDFITVTYSFYDDNGNVASRPIAMTVSFSSQTSGSFINDDLGNEPASPYGRGLYPSSVSARKFLTPFGKGSSNVGVRFISLNSTGNISVSSTTLEIGVSPSPSSVGMGYDPVNSRIFLAYGSGVELRLIVANDNLGTPTVVAGPTVILTEVSGANVKWEDIRIATDNNGNFIVSAKYGGREVFVTYGTNRWLVAGNVSGNTITTGTPTKYSDSSWEVVYNGHDIVYSSTDQKYYLAWVDKLQNYGAFRKLSVNPSTYNITVDLAEYFLSAYTEGVSLSIGANTNPGSISLTYTEGYDSGGGDVKYKSYTTDHEIQVPVLSANNFLGFSDGNYANGETATIDVVGAVNDAQSGLTPGSIYYIQSDGSGITDTYNGSTAYLRAGLSLSSTKILVKR